MYIVPLDIPKHCNKCPFGYIEYQLLVSRGCISKIDGKMNETGTYGYVCNVEFQDNHKYTKVIRAKVGENIERPDWCRLKGCGE